ncbi:MAG: DUF1273 domain-containing protein [Anaerofustis stercorihominis]|nr:DUF1273 domain-containing protein [Anaerofustis stercorihominis]
MKNKTCCFTGHRTIYDNEKDLRNKTVSVVKTLINSGYVFFGTGGARGFDLLAAEVIISMKKRYPHIKLIFVLPFKEHTKGWKKDDIILYKKLEKYADKVRVLSDEYYDGCMQKRNRHLVDNSSICIAYKRKNSGGTAYTSDYAEKMGLKIIYL